MLLSVARIALLLALIACATAGAGAATAASGEPVCISSYRLGSPPSIWAFRPFRRSVSFMPTSVMPDTDTDIDTDSGSMADAAGATSAEEIDNTSNNQLASPTDAATATEQAEVDTTTGSDISTAATAGDSGEVSSSTSASEASTEGTTDTQNTSEENGPISGVDNSSSSSSTGSASPIICLAVPPPSDGLLVPMYLVDHHTAGSSIHVDYFMVDGWRRSSSVCVGDAPTGCSIMTGCESAACGGEAIFGLGVSQVQTALDETARIPEYRNNADDGNKFQLQSTDSQDPYLVSSYHRHSIHSRDSFASWFTLSNDSASTTGTNFILRDALFQIVSPTRIGREGNSNLPHYLFECESPCFPIDHLLFGNENLDVEQDPIYAPYQAQLQNHNWGFSAQIHSVFQWRGSATIDTDEFITIYASDDAFVYIDSKLVIDLGGMHGVECRTLNMRSGIVTGGIAAYIDGAYTCPQSVIPAAFARLTSFDSTGFTAGQRLPISFFFTQRSAPRVYNGQLLVASMWRIETNIALSTSPDLAAVPPGAPAPFAVTRVSNPTIGFIATIDSGNDDTDAEQHQLSSNKPLFLHTTIKPTESIRLTLNTVPTGATVIRCTDSTGLSYFDPIDFPACNTSLSRVGVLSLTPLGLGSVGADPITSLIQCRAESSGLVTVLNNIDGATFTFEVKVATGDTQPTPIIQQTSIRPTESSQYVSLQLNGAESFDRSGFLRSSQWSIVERSETDSNLTFTSPTSLVTDVLGLPYSGVYVFQLTVVDGWEQSASVTLTVVPSADPDTPVYQLTSSSSTGMEEELTEPSSSTAEEQDDYSYSSTGAVVPFTDYSLAVSLYFAGLDLVGDSSLQSFLVDSLSVISRRVTPTDTTRIQIATRQPYFITNQQRADQVNITLIATPASTEEQPTAKSITDNLLYESNTPSSVLRSQLPSLMFASLVDVPTVLDPPPEYPHGPNAAQVPSDSGPPYSKVGLGIGLTAAILLIASCIGYQLSRRRSLYTRHESDGAAFVDRHPGLVGDRESVSDSVAASTLSDHQVGWSHHDGADSDTMLRLDGAMADQPEWAARGLDHTQDIEMQTQQRLTTTSDREAHADDDRAGEGQHPNDEHSIAPSHIISAQLLSDEDEVHDVDLNEVAKKV